jgi:ribonuclease P protein component
MKSAGDFARVRKDGSSAAGRHLVLAVLPDPELNEFRFGLITGRKIGPAVQRNRVRRRLREIIRAHRSNIRPGFLIVTIGRWSSPKATYQQLERDWLKLARRAGLLQDPNAKTP